MSTSDMLHRLQDRLRPLLPIQRIEINHIDYAELRKAGRGFLNIQTSVQAIKRGYMADLEIDGQWAALYSHRTIPLGALKVLPVGQATFVDLEFSFSSEQGPGLLGF